MTLERQTVEQAMKGMKLLLYADPGNAKTTFASTAAQVPEMSPTLHIDIDGGLLTIRDMNIEEPPTVTHIDTTKDFEALFWLLKQRNEQFEDISTVVIDNCTELMGMALEETIKANINVKSRGGKKRSSLDDAWIEDRGAAGNQMARLFRWYRELDQHVIYTAHVRREFPRKGDMPDVTKPPISVAPDFPPALSRRLRGYVDAVWFLSRSDDVVSVLTQPRGAYYAKTRGVRLQEVFQDGFKWPVGHPVMEAVYNTIYKGEDFPLATIPAPTMESRVEPTETLDKEEK